MGYENSTCHFEFTGYRMLYRSQRLLITLMLLFILSSSISVNANESSEFKAEPLVLYLDADLSGGSKQAGLAIQQGIELALREVNFQIRGIPIQLKLKDHRGSTPRSLSNLKKALADPRALAVFGGLHSPPLLANKLFINENQLLTFVPWAAAGPITRSGSEENWIFRLSIDDSRAGDFIVREAINKERFKRPFLLLEDTGWGRSNFNTMTKQLNELGIQPVGVHRFNWNLGKHEGKLIAKSVVASGADVIFLVANAPEGRLIIEELMNNELSRAVAIRSHWGITGGDFYSLLSANTKAHLDLKFIQTRFSFLQSELSSRAQQVVQTLMRLNPQIQSAEDIHSPTGVIHGYDLTMLLLTALDEISSNNVDVSKDIQSVRKAVKDKLESLKTETEGLVKNYIQPFRPYSQEDINAHEALTPDDYAMGTFDESGVIRLSQ